jgi:hypothetical protein
MPACFMASSVLPLPADTCSDATGPISVFCPSLTSGLLGGADEAQALSAIEPATTAPTPNAPVKKLRLSILFATLFPTFFPALVPIISSCQIWNSFILVALLLKAN